MVGGHRIGDHAIVAGMLATIPVTSTGWTDLVEIRLLGERWGRGGGVTNSGESKFGWTPSHPSEHRGNENDHAQRPAASQRREGMARRSS